MADVLYRQGRVDEAIAALESAIEVAPEKARERLRGSIAHYSEAKRSSSGR